MNYQPPVERLLLSGTFAISLLACLLVGPDSAPLLEDNQHYYFMAERAASGVPPHVSNFDPKHMLAPLLSAVGILFGRAAGISDVIAARLPSILVFCLSSSLLALLTYRLTDRWIAAVLAGVAFPTFGYLLKLAVIGARPKVFLVFFMLLALYAVTRGRWKTACASGGLAFLSWQPGVLIPTVVLLTMKVSGLSWRRLAAGTVAALAPVLLYEAYFVLAGGVGAQLTQSYLFPALYMQGEMSPPSEAYRMLSWLWTTGYGWNILPLVAVGGGTVVAHRLVTSYASISEWISREPGWTVFMGTMMLAGAITYYDHQGPPDLFFVLPFVAVLSGIAVDWAAKYAGRIVPRVPSASLGVLAIVSFLVGAVTTGNAVRSSFGHDIDSQRRLAQTVEEWRQEGHTVYAVGRTTHILALERRSNWTPYSQFFRGVGAFLEDRGMVAPFVPCRQGRLPRIVLFAGRHHPPGWPLWLQSRYERRTPPEFAEREIQVWRAAEEARCTRTWSRTVYRQGPDKDQSLSGYSPPLRQSPSDRADPSVSFRPLPTASVGGSCQRRPHSRSQRAGSKPFNPPPSYGVISPT